MSRVDWEAWRDGGAYEPASLATEGFVHCTGDDDLMLAVANRFYADEPGDFVVVSLDPDRLTRPVRWEPPAHPDGARPADDEPRFPHVYGRLDRGASSACGPCAGPAAGSPATSPRRSEPGRLARRVVGRFRRRHST